MDHPYSSPLGGVGGGGNWVMIPNNTQSHNTSPLQQPQQQPLQPSLSNQDLSQYQQHLQYQQQHQQQQQQQRQQQQQQQNTQTLASHFNLIPLVENLSEVTENGTRDQNSDMLVNELTAHFDKCQNFLNTIAGSINAKAMTVEGQKRKVEESEQLLNQRRELIAQYRGSLEKLIKSDG